MSIQIKRLFSNPIFIGTLTLLYGGLIVSLVCGIIKSIYVAATTWFIIAYLLLLALALVLAILTNTLNQYRLALLTMIGVGLSSNIGHIGYYINARSGPLQAMSAGLIFVEIMLFFWVLVLGSGPGTYLASLCGMDGDSSSGSAGVANDGGMQPGDMSMKHINYRTTMGGAQPVVAPANTSSITDYYTSELTQSIMTSKQPESPTGAYKARALYAYDANPDDPNEVSFAKDEVMYVIDDSGKWWQVKKSDSTVDFGRFKNDILVGCIRYFDGYRIGNPSYIVAPAAEQLSAERIALDSIDDAAVETIGIQKQSRFPSDMNKDIWKELADICMVRSGDSFPDVQSLGWGPLQAQTIMRLVYQAGYLAPIGKDCVGISNSNVYETRAQTYKQLGNSLENF
ncbi:Transmembrane osmosensor [Coemansia sp. RSA 2049]|nr:Transmembrane osmosensor [Coemansia sp. RSA 2049]